MNVAYHVRGLPPGAVIDDRFTVIAKIGSGGEGAVYHCEDRRLLRDVAVKILRPTDADGADRTRYAQTFLREARAQARLPHPNVAIVHDVGVVDGVAPYIVSEFIRGRSLREELATGPLDSERSIHVLAQIAEAIAYAHENGVIHRDVKPENIRLSEEDHVKVIDFGLAHCVRSATLAALADDTTADRPHWGTPGYMPPEQLAGAPPHPSADIWAFGKMASQLLDGCSAHLDDLIARCLLADPESRPSAIDCVHELLRVQSSLGPDPRRRAVPVVEACPFPGLRAFDEEDARFFYGRTNETQQCLDLLNDGTKGWLAIEGTSGTGKSSLLVAGLIPAIRRGWLPAGCDRCRVVLLRPGPNPMASLRRALAEVFGTTVRKQELIERSLVDGSLVDVVENLMSPTEALFIVVDQLEELFTLSESPNGREEFETILANTLGSEHPCWLVSSIRSDFVDRYQQLTALHDLLNTRAARYSLRTMSGSALGRALHGPAALAGGQFEPGLLHRILEDAGQAEGALPLVAHVLRALWDASDDGVMTHRAYAELGGLAGALASSADGVLDRLDDDRRSCARRLLLALIRSSRSNQRWTRRVLARAEALEAAGSGAAPRDTLDVLIEGRLVTSKDTTVELAHEALIDAWPTLAGWVRAEERALQLRDDLESAAVVWESAGRPEGGLARGDQLVYFEGAASAGPGAQDYLAQSRAFARRLEEARFSTLRRRVALLTVVAVLLAGVTSWAVVSQRRAETNRVAALEVADVLIHQIDGKLSRLPGTAKVRGDLIDTANTLLSRLGDETDTQRRVAEGHFRGALLSSAAGREEEIARELAAAIAANRALIAKDPSDVRARIDLSRALTRFAYELHMKNWGPEGLVKAIEAVDVLEPAIADNPGLPSVSLQYISALHDLARSYAFMGNGRAAERHERMAFAAWHDLSADDPRMTPKAWARALLTIYAGLSRAMRIQRRYAEAVVYAELALEQNVSPPLADPTSRTQMRAVIWSQVMVSKALRFAGRYEEAAAIGEAAIANAEANDADEPEPYYTHRETVIVSHQRTAQGWLGAEDFKKARRHFDRSLHSATELEEANGPGPSLSMYFADAYQGLADMALQEADSTAAVNFAEQAIRERARTIAQGESDHEFSGSGAAIHRTLAQALDALGRYDEAELAREEAARMLAEADARIPRDRSDSQP